MTDADETPADESSPAEGGIQPLRAASMRIEDVVIGSLVNEGDDTVFEEMQGLQPASTRTEGIETDDTPLILLDDDDCLDTDSDELSIPALVGEVKRLRSHNQIIRTERTSIAGRKYALEIVIESLREKAEEAGESLDELEAVGQGDPEEFAAIVQGLRLILDDLRRIADSKAVLEQDLEEERRRHLEERQAFEQKASEHEETIQGLRHERDSLRTTVATVEQDRLDWMERLADVQERLEDEELARGQVEAEAATQLESYAERMRALEEREESAVEAREGAEARIKTLEREALEGADGVAAQLEEANERVSAAQAQIASGEQRAQAESSLGETLRSEVTALESERDTLRQELEAALSAQDALRSERDTLETERDEVTGERYSIAGELEEAITSRDAISAERDGLAAQVGVAEEAIEALKEDLAAASARANQAGERVVSVESKAASQSDVFGALQVQLEELEAAKSVGDKLVAEQRQALRDVKPLVEDWSRLDKECQRLARLVGEARSRGRVDVQELIARAALLRRLERLTQ